MVKCPTCNGQGHLNGGICANCEGRGVVYFDRTTFGLLFLTVGMLILYTILYGILAAYGLVPTF